MRSSRVLTVEFHFTDWFMGWTYKRNEIINAQPNDDGWSGQDCVEVRQVINPQEKPFSTFILGGNRPSLSSGNTYLHSPLTDNRFYWNDRNCEVKNFYICERATYQSK
jgi:hypothetical protein